MRDADRKASSEPSPSEVETAREDSGALRAAAKRWWPDIPHASGPAIAWALVRLGFDVRLGGAQYAVVTKDSTVSAIVPLSDRVHPAVISVLLTSLGVSPRELGEALETPEEE